ncbi:MAG: transglycosylase family protein [Microthrixaceae bacterium]|nr:transglycosylase family protein [Microthrixaceae bacterium]
MTILTLSALLPVFGGSASAAGDPVVQAKAALTNATNQRIAVERRIGEIKTGIQSLEQELGQMDEADAALTRELADAKDAMRQFAISAYIDGGKADVAAASLDPTDAQALVWQSTLSVGQAASADEVARRFEELKAAVGPKRLQIARNLEAAERSLKDANNDVIQAAAFERDAEAKLAVELEAARQRAEEERARAREAAANEAKLASTSNQQASKKSNTRGTGAASPTGSDAARESSGAARGNPTASESATLARIRRCESRGNYQIVSSSGRYRGAYQFDYRTWAGVGGSGDPAAASPAEQDYRALLLLRQRGTRPWPICGR